MTWNIESASDLVLGAHLDDMPEHLQPVKQWLTCVDNLSK